MKKVICLFIAVTALCFSSCNRDGECVCTYAGVTSLQGTMNKKECKDHEKALNERSEQKNVKCVLEGKTSVIH